MVGATNSSYELIVRSDTEFEGPIAIHAVGEDGHPENVRLNSAALARTGDALPVDGNTVAGVSLTPSDPLRLHIELVALERRSLIASPVS